VPGRQTVLSLWSLAASPLILGSNLTRLCPADLKLLRNKGVLAVEQDGIDAHLVVSGRTSKVVAKTEPGGTVAAGLFNTTASPESISVTASALGLPASGRYRLVNLWTHRTTRSHGAIRARVPAHGVAYFEIRADPAGTVR